MNVNGQWVHQLVGSPIRKEIILLPGYVSNNHQSKIGPLCSACSRKRLSVEDGTGLAGVPSIPSLGTKYHPQFQYLTCEPIMKERNWHGCRRAESDWMLQGSVPDVNVSQDNIRGLREAWTPKGDSCRRINQDLWIILGAHIRAQFG